MNVLVQLFLFLGILFAVIGNIGVLTFPDVYTRLQASSTCSTTSVFSFFVAALLSSDSLEMGGRIVVIALFYLISGPLSAHIIARFAWTRGLQPWRHIAPRPAAPRGKQP